jgi:hypothetical protein
VLRTVAVTAHVPAAGHADRALRLQLAQRTRRGFGMTLAAAL